MSYFGIPVEPPPSGSQEIPGAPTADTALPGTNSRQLATTEFVITEINGLIGSAPALLNTLGELADALNDNANFATTVLDSLNNKQPLNTGLTSLSGLTTSANNLPYLTGVGTYALTPFTSAARTFLAATDATAQRAALALNNVENTTDLNKVVSTATSNQLALKANAANAALTGVPTAPTAAASTNTTQIASTAYVMAETSLKASLTGAIFSGHILVPAGATGSQAPRRSEVDTAITSAIAGTQPLNAKLTAVAGVTYAVDTFAYFTGASTAAVTSITAAGRTFLAAATPLDQRTALGIGTLSGNNTGDQTITLTGNITGSGTGSFATTISPGVVTNANFAPVAVNTIKGRITAGSGDVQDLTAANVRTIINVADGANNYVHPNHSGDVSSTADGATVINPNVVSLAKMAQLATATILGRSTAGTGNVEAMTVAATKILLGLNNVENIADINKVVSNATTTQLNLKANATGGTLAGPVITNYVETLYVPTSAATHTIDLNNGTFQKINTTSNTTITLPTSVAGKSFTIIIAFGGSHTITFTGGNLIWGGGTAPIPTSVNTKKDIYVFIQDGTNTYGQDGGRNF